MISPAYHSLGASLDKLAGSIQYLAKSNPGEHKILREGRTFSKVGYRLLAGLQDEESPLVPPDDDPGYYEVSRQWLFIFSLLALATTGGRRLVTSKGSLGGAMRQAAYQDGTVNCFMVEYPTFHKDTVTHHVKRLVSARAWFDLTPIAYGLLYPTAADIPEIKHAIGKDFWVFRKRQHAVQTAAEIAETFRPSPEPQASTV
jgi:hypothetical protein